MRRSYTVLFILCAILVYARQSWSGKMHFLYTLRGISRRICTSLLSASSVRPSTEKLRKRRRKPPRSRVLLLFDERAAPINPPPAFVGIVTVRCRPQPGIHADKGDGLPRITIDVDRNSGMWTALIALRDNIDALVFACGPVDAALYMGGNDVHFDHRVLIAAEDSAWLTCPLGPVPGNRNMGLYAICDLDLHERLLEHRRGAAGCHLHEDHIFSTSAAPPLCRGRTVQNNRVCLDSIGVSSEASPILDAESRALLIGVVTFASTACR